MIKIRSLVLCVVWLVSASLADAQKAGTPQTPKQNTSAATEQEIRAFYESYAEDLRKHRRESIVERYDPSGVFMLGNGWKAHETFENVKQRYMTKWTGPKSFTWKDMSIEVLSPDSVVVLARFDWETVAGQIHSYSYTGVLKRQAGKWRIRVEDESTSPNKPSSP